MRSLSKITGIMGRWLDTNFRSGFQTVKKSSALSL